MERGGMVALGIGLLVLWLVGLSDLATRWLSWLNGAAGVAALVAAGSALGPERVTGSAAGSSVAIAIGLFVLWVIGLAAGATGWLTVAMPFAFRAGLPRARAVPGRGVAAAAGLSADHGAHDPIGVPNGRTRISIRLQTQSRPLEARGEPAKPMNQPAAASATGKLPRAISQIIETFLNMQRAGIIHFGLESRARPGAFARRRGAGRG